MYTLNPLPPRIDPELLDLLRRAEPATSAIFAIPAS